jgi:alkanesulfonate monooxygenase SsuD/methylene tetrahydromethanopterin reductase-like flavin-dependent oxidoreductase (luciferase family)
VKIGFYVTGSATSGYGDLLDQIQFADDAGFHSVWLRERHFHPDHQGRNFFSSPFVAASYIAARTKRVRIGMGARILPLDHPIHIAEDGATVDVISNGRLDLGIARIGENETYQNAFGIPAAEVRERFEQSLEVILKAWTEERFSHDGPYYHFPDVSIHPKPVQKPHPPIYLVGISDSTLKFGAARGFPLLLAGAQTVPLVAKTQETYDRLLAEGGFKREDIVHPVNRFIYVAETNQQAIEDTRETIMNFIHRENSVIRDFLLLPKEQITYELLFNEVCIFGDPDFCLRRIEALQAAVDLRHVVFTFNYFTIDHQKCLRSMERFVNRVMPHLKRTDV